MPVNVVIHQPAPINVRVVATQTASPSTKKSTLTRSGRGLLLVQKSSAALSSRPPPKRRDCLRPKSFRIGSVKCPNWCCPASCLVIATVLSELHSQSKASLDRGVKQTLLPTALATRRGHPGDLRIKADRQQSTLLQAVILTQPICGLVRRRLSCSETDIGYSHSASLRTIVFSAFQLSQTGPLPDRFGRS